MKYLLINLSYLIVGAIKEGLMGGQSGRVGILGWVSIISLASKTYSSLTVK